MKKIIYSIIAIVLFSGLTSCDKDALEPTTAQAKDIATSINTEDDVQSILLGVLDRMSSYRYYGRNAIVFGEIRSSNAFGSGNSGSRLTEVAAMNLQPEDGDAERTWSSIYRVITSCNYLTRIDPESITGDQGQIKHYIGQAFAIRAMAHYDLLRFYGQQHVTGGTLGIPYIKTTLNDSDPSENGNPSRNTIEECKTFIMEDLNQAIALMNDSYHESSSYMSANGAKALTARIALYFEDWATAKANAMDVINSGAYSIIPADQFAASWSIDNSANSIFEMEFSGTDNPGSNGLAHVYHGLYRDVEALPNILGIFDDNDVRGGRVGGLAMIDFDPDPVYAGKLRNLGKYPSKTNSDNVPLIRYEEVILICAEANLELGDAPAALNYLNMVPAMRNANAYTEATKANILLERRKELIFEGFAFDDFARTHSDIPLVNPALQAHGGPAYGSHNFAFPIPLHEMNANPNMVQNAGY